MSDHNNNSFKSAFFIIPSHILDLPGITLTYLKFYETMFQFWNHGKRCFLSNAAIMERTGIKSLSSIHDAFKYFENHGLIRRLGHDNNRYIVQVASVIDIESNEEGGIAGAIGGGSLERSGGIAGAIPEIKNLNKETNKTYIYKKEKNSKTEKPKTTYTLENMQANNPNNIPASMIRDWITNRSSRKCPITATAWERLNNQLKKCPDVIEAFAEMVARGWMSINPEWLESGKKKKDYLRDDLDWDLNGKGFPL